MRRIYKYLYWDASIPEKKRNRIKWHVKVQYLKMRPLYLVLLSSGQEQLEIYYSPILNQKLFRKQSQFVIGISASYEGAIAIVANIAQECYEKYHNCDLKYYLSQLDKAPNQ